MIEVIVTYMTIGSIMHLSMMSRTYLRFVDTLWSMLTIRDMYYIKNHSREVYKAEYLRQRSYRQYIFAYIAINDKRICITDKAMKLLYFITYISPTIIDLTNFPIERTLITDSTIALWNYNAYNQSSTQYFSTISTCMKHNIDEIKHKLIWQTEDDLYDQLIRYFSSMTDSIYCYVAWNTCVRTPNFDLQYNIIIAMRTDYKLSDEMMEVFTLLLDHLDLKARKYISNQ